MIIVIVIVIGFYGSRDAFSAEWGHLREWSHALVSPFVEPATEGDVHINGQGYRSYDERGLGGNGCGPPLAGLVQWTVSIEMMGIGWLCVCVW